MARLEKRRRLYYAVRDIPLDAQKRIGKSRFLRSTGTGDHAAAKLVAATFDVSWLEMIRNATRPENDSAPKETAEDRMHRRANHWRQRIANAAPSSRDIIIEQMKEEASQEADPSDHDDFHGIRRGELFVEIALGEHAQTDEHLDSFLEAKARDTKPKTIDLYRGSLVRFCQHFPKTSDVNHQSVKDWVAQLRDEGTKDNTLQRTFSAVRGYWRHLQDRGVVTGDNDPFANVLKVGSQSKNRRGKATPYVPFEPVDVVKLLNSAVTSGDDALANLVTLGMWTGCRIESLCSLKVEDVKDDTLRVSDKTDAGDRIVPVHEKLKGTLSELCANSADGYVLSGLSSNKYGDRSNAIGKRFGRLKERMGFEGRQWGFHSIRKTVVTQLQHSNVPEEITMSIVGHENRSITYGLYSAGPSLNQKRAAIAKLSYPTI